MIVTNVPAKQKVVRPLAAGWLHNRCDKTRRSVLNTAVANLLLLVVVVVETLASRPPAVAQDVQIRGIIKVQAGFRRGCGGLHFLATKPPRLS
jgi:hypothetical protein